MTSTQECFVLNNFWIQESIKQILVMQIALRKVVRSDPSLTTLLANADIKTSAMIKKTHADNRLFYYLHLFSEYFILKLYWSWCSVFFIYLFIFFFCSDSMENATGHLDSDDYIGIKSLCFILLSYTCMSLLEKKSSVIQKKLSVSCITILSFLLGATINYVTR